MTHGLCNVRPLMMPGPGAAASPTAVTDVLARLHDGPLQVLTAAMQELDEPEPDAAAARALVGDAVAAIRSLLGPPSLTVTRTELIGELDRWATIVLRPQIAWTVDVADDLERISFMTYEFARELITNAARHAAPRAVTVTVGLHDGVELLVVEDDGVGMSDTWTAGFGLGAMYRRAFTAGGDVDHRARLPCGTVATVRLPPRHPPAL